MKIIQGVQEWADVTLLENGEALTGGEDGKANIQAKALVNRTAWLRKKAIHQVNGKVADEENQIEIEAKDIPTSSGETVQEELEQKSNQGHSHQLLDQVPTVSLENAGKSLVVSQSGEMCEWQMIGGVPVGTIIAWAGEKPPVGYLECNGASLSRKAYKGLFEAIGTIWGSNDEETFKLPDFYSAARFLRSRSDGLDVGSKQEDAIRNIEGFFDFVGNSNSGYWVNDSELFKMRGTTTTPVQPAGNSIYTLGRGFSFDTSRVVPTAEENRPKSAVVMYCIKAVDEYVNPSQVDMGQIDQQKVNIADVKMYAGTRLWKSEEFLPVANAPTIAAHNLGVDPLDVRADVQLKCISDNAGYLAGEIAGNWFAWNGLTLTNAPTVTENQIRYNTGSTNGYLYVQNKLNGSHTTCDLNKWRYVFRIWY